MALVSTRVPSPNRLLSVGVDVGLHQKREDIKSIVAALSPKPVNILMSSNTGLRVADLAEMGVRRVSVGSSLARAAWGGFIRAAKAIAQEGSFAGFVGSAPFSELNASFREDHKKRS